VSADAPTTPRTRKPAVATEASATTRVRKPAATAATATVAAETTADASEPRRRLLVGNIPMTTAAAAVGIAGLLGGGIGAGVVGLAGGTFRTVVQPQAVTINNPTKTTSATAVAAKSLQSVVTVEVSGQNGAGSGSGVIYSADGYIITNNHVATLAGTATTPTIRVTLSDGRLFPAKIIGTDPTLDVAVLKIDATGLTPIEWADSAKVEVGSDVIAIGAPLGLQNTVTEGVVSAVNRSITINDKQGGNTFDLPGQSQTQASQALSLPVIQTDASINPGNSGGALLNSSGQLVGINVAIASSGQSNGSIGVGFALPSTLVQRVATDIIENGSAKHGRIGAMVSSVTGSTGVIGAEVQGVDSGSPAAQAGLQKGDIITTFNGIPIRDEIDITAQVRSLRPGTTVNFTYVRGGTSHDGTVTVGSLE
jgi:putative serine protease PepD